MLRVIRRRHPNIHILLYPVPVQGPEAAPNIVEALRYFNREKNADVIILGRGGGSLEDLWAFNEEAVARAVHASGIPVISAVGHETDYTIADFVADLRAPTPSAAAEMVVASEASFREAIHALEMRLARTMRQTVGQARASLNGYARLLGDPRRVLGRHAQRIDELAGRLSTSLTQALRRDRVRLAGLISGLDHLNPLAILSRGYSVTQVLPAGSLLKDAAAVKPGDLLSTRLHTGSIVSRVDSVSRDEENS